MPGTSFQPQSIKTQQLNIRKGPFDSVSIDELPAATPANDDEKIHSGMVVHVDDNREVVRGLVDGKLPAYAFTDADDPVHARPEVGMMAGNRIKAFRHNAPVELSTTQFTSAITDATPIGTPLTSANAGGDAAADSGKLRPRAASEPIVGYLTRPVYKGSEGHDIIDFTPAYVAGTY